MPAFLVQETSPIEFVLDAVIMTVDDPKLFLNFVFFALDGIRVFLAELESDLAPIR